MVSQPIDHVRSDASLDPIKRFLSFAEAWLRLFNVGVSSMLQAEFYLPDLAADVLFFEFDSQFGSLNGMFITL